MARHAYETDRVEQTKNGIKYIKAKAGRIIWFHNAHSDAERGETMMHTAVGRMFKTVQAGEYADLDLERIEWFLDRVERWLGAMRKELERRRGTVKVEDRIAMLRNTNGRSPEEAALYLKKAEELERGLSTRA
jgi:hypothetical protein